MGGDPESHVIHYLFILQSYSSSSPPDKITLAIHSISVEPGSSLARDSAITQLFVEFQFLNCDYKDLDTVSVKKPVIVDSEPFNFTKGMEGVTYVISAFIIVLCVSISCFLVFDFTSASGENARLLLAEMLKVDSPSDGK